MNKEDCEILINKLANKELTFGCKILETDKRRGKFEVTYICETERTQGREFTAYINHLGSVVSWYKSDLKTMKILGHPIMKVHVEEKIILKEATMNGWNANIEKLHKLWFKCGITKSLQQIIEESGYLKRPADGKKTILKDPNARALAEFLMNIFNNND